MRDAILDPQAGDTIRGVDGFDRHVWSRSGGMVTWSFVAEELEAAGLRASRPYYDESVTEWRRKHREATVVRRARDPWAC